MRLIYHKGTGTYIAADECEIIDVTDEVYDALEQGELPAPKGDKVDDPWSAIWLTGAAIREHYENWDQEETIEGLTDEDLDNAGKWAMDSSFLWDSVYAAMDLGVEQVKAAQED